LKINEYNDLKANNSYDFVVLSANLTKIVIFKRNPSRKYFLRLCLMSICYFVKLSEDVKLFVISIKFC